MAPAWPCLALAWTPAPCFLVALLAEVLAVSLSRATAVVFPLVVDPPLVRPVRELFVVALGAGSA